MGYNWITTVIFRLVSILQASTLRDRYYLALTRVGILHTALEDIQRINRASSNPNPLVERITQQSLGD
jgi:hypothetical protein